MQKMSEKEAIEHIKNTPLMMMEEDRERAGRGKGDLARALDVAISALEKQIPKSPTYDGDGYAPDGTFVWDEWLCPNCGTRYEVDYEDYDYCPNCGQAIHWEEAEAALERMKGEEHE